ncbi:M14-like domain containing protein [Caulobacteraceae bacterium]|eukprot:gene12683-17005_t
MQNNWLSRSASGWISSMLALILALFLATPAAAQPTSAALLPPQVAARQVAPPHVVPGTTYNPAIPTPTDALGFTLGEHPVRHHDLLAYLGTLDRLSDRISVEEIGRSHERRPILLLKITSPANHARLEQLRTEHLGRLEAGVEAPADAPVFVWANFGVHGAEASAQDAALATVYHFAAATGSEMDAMLDRAVILVVAVLNPDGHALRVSRVDRFSGEAGVSDPSHFQHSGWGEARVNHYGFDLNRDWLLLSQPEARAWVGAWQRWVPQLSLDHHEMGSNSSFYFHPGEPRRVNALITRRQTELADRIAGYHSRALDPDGVLYYAEEGFDNFYIGKGSTYPQVNGGVGILYEAGTAAGGAVEGRNGLRTYAENIRLQFRANLAAVTGAIEIRRDLTASQTAYFRQARASARASGPAAYVVAAPDDPARMQRFLGLLAIHGVTAHALTETIEAGGRRFEAGRAYLVPTDQRQAAMVRGIFETPKSFEESVFYDVSAWTMPLAYDLNWAALEPGAFRPRLLGERARGGFDRQPAPATVLAEGPYGYVVRWSDRAAPRVAGELLRAGLMVRTASAPFEAATPSGPVAFGRGALFVPTAGQQMDAAAVHALMGRLARESSAMIAPVVSGRTPSPATDLGGNKSWTTVTRPEILLLFTGDAPRMEAGEAWWLLDHEMGLPVTLRRASELSRTELSRYTHVLILGAASSGWTRAETEALTRWTRGGGVLIASGAAAQWAQRAFAAETSEAAAASTGASRSTRPVAGPALAPASDGNEAKTPDQPAARPAEPSRDRRDFDRMEIGETEHIIAGALFQSDLDPSHPLAFGHTDRDLAIMKVGTAVLEWPRDDAYAVVARYRDAPLLAGYASRPSIARVAGAPAVTAAQRGTGTLVLFADNPTFRGTFPGTERLLLNAIFMNRHIRAPRAPDLSDEID